MQVQFKTKASYEIKTNKIETKFTTELPVRSKYMYYFVNQLIYHSIIEGCVRYIFASLCFDLKEGTCQMKKNVFYFTSKPLFVLEKIKF